MLTFNSLKKKLNIKRLKFLLVSLLASIALFSSLVIPYDARLLYSVLFVFFALVFTFASLEVKFSLKITPILMILPLHLLIGALGGFYVFPNLSLLMRLIITFVIFNLYYIMLLVLNIFSVVEERGKSMPLFRVASTWAQILIVIVSIPFYSVVFKLPIHPLLQVLVVAFSTFCLVLFYLVMLDLEINEIDLNLAFLSAFWVMILSFAILFLPFEAFFRGLFLSSVLLFGIGFSYHTLKHSLTRKITLEYIMITIAFLFIGLIFIP